MNKQRLDEIKERAEKATPGSWYFYHRDPDLWIGTGSGIDAWVSEVGDENIDDARFIAHAREDIPWLISEVERLREELEDGARDMESKKRMDRIYEQDVKCEHCGKLIGYAPYMRDAYCCVKCDREGLNETPFIDTAQEDD